MGYDYMGDRTEGNQDAPAEDRDDVPPGCVNKMTNVENVLFSKSDDILNEFFNMFESQADVDELKMSVCGLDDEQIKRLGECFNGANNGADLFACTVSHKEALDSESVTQ